MTDEIRGRLINTAKHYDKESLTLFLAEVGWEDWMNDYTDAEDGEPISEREAKEIDDILIDIFNEAHEE